MARSQLLYKASADTGFHGDAEFRAFESEEILEKFPEILGRMKPALEIMVRGTGIREMPSSIIQHQTHLTFLELSSMSNLVALPSRICMLKGLVKLNVSHCSKLVALPSSIGMLKGLVKLNVSHCSKLVALPSSIGMLKGLVNLNVSFCSKLETLPGEIGNLGNLVKLDVSWCSKLESLPEEIGDLDNLVKLKASYTQISQPPYSIVQLNKLIFLSFERQCLEDGVYFVFPQVDGGLRSLQILDLSFCNLIDEGLPEDVGCLSSLKELHLSGNNFEHFPGSIAQLVALKTLYLHSCQNF
ncbi:TMV resistance protein N-like [Solanum stenotomum]|uniref:TMV resistance protein N-like n=1 Tax=Solanum stenotomum TaxID=172797 RepID=UPI0020D0C59D|nr:TMV resistance protein N-like [Solanum stenotomum]